MLLSCLYILPSRQALLGHLRDWFRDMEQRDITRDVVRGLNALEMSFVNISNIGWSNHSGYIDQPKYADTIFPFFAFVSGMSRIPTRRSVGLIGLGLALQSVSAYSNKDVYRIPGVLQRLGLASLWANASNLRPLQRLSGLPFIGLWLAISLALGNPSNPFAHPLYSQADPAMTAQTKIDSALFGQHIYTPSHDPEGLLGALTTAASMLIGKTFIMSSRSYGNLYTTMSAIAMIGAGEALHLYSPKYFPLSKGLWTPSFVLVTSGFSILKFIAAEQVTPWLPNVIKYILSCTGRRSLEIYVLSTLVELWLLHGGSKSWWNHGLSFLARHSNRTMADFLLSSAFTAVMALSAVFLVRNNLRLTW